MKLQHFQKLQYHSMGNDMMQEKNGKRKYAIYHMLPFMFVFLCLYFYVCIFMFVFLCLY